MYLSYILYVYMSNFLFFLLMGTWFVDRFLCLVGGIWSSKEESGVMVGVGCVSLGDET